MDSETIHALLSKNNHAILELCVHIGSNLTCSFSSVLG